MSNKNNCEIERKYLISMPDESALAKASGCAVWKITQIYLIAEPGCTRRIRAVETDEKTIYFKTIKRRVSSLTAEEYEGEISKQEYDRLLCEANHDLRPIIKTRYRIPYKDQLLEYDIYPFWSDRAILEIELETEDQETYIPEEIHVLKDVTDDYRYKNISLAATIPTDPIEGVL